MPSTAFNTQSSFQRWAKKIFRYLSIGAAAIWLLTAVTGVLLTFHFEVEDARLSTAHYPTDFTAIENRMDQLTISGVDARTNWIWTTAGLSDRYIINYTDAAGTIRTARVLGNGDVLRNEAVNKHSFLEFIREAHLELVSGRTGEIILGISGILLVINILMGGYIAWPHKRSWVNALKPAHTGSATDRLSSWHRALGLWVVIPLLVIVITGTMIEFEHDIEHLVGLEPSANILPANPATATPIGFAEAAQSALSALSGSQFVGAVFPTDKNASYEMWLRSKGELFRSYGGSLVVVDANDATIRGTFPASDLSAGNKFILYLYTFHTGEAIGLIGRILVLLTGIWLATAVGMSLLKRIKQKV